MCACGAVCRAAGGEAGGTRRLPLRVFTLFVGNNRRNSAAPRLLLKGQVAQNKPEKKVLLSRFVSLFSQISVLDLQKNKTFIKVVSSPDENRNSDLSFLSELIEISKLITQTN